MNQTNKLASQILSRAQDLVKTGWTQGALARDKNGQYTSEYSLEACSFCTLGAYFRAARELSVQDVEVMQRVRVLAWSSLETAINEFPGGRGNISSFNDNPIRTVEQVIAVFEKAKSLLEAQSVETV